MYSTLKRLFGLGLLSEEEIKDSTDLGWITPEQYTDITGKGYYDGSTGHSIPDEPKNLKIRENAYSVNVTIE